MLSLAKKFSDKVGLCLLYSGHDFDSAKRSFLFLYPTRIVSIDDNDLPWESLKSQVSFNHSIYPEWFGFFSYEIGAFSDREKTTVCYDSELPKALFVKAGIVLVVDHEKNLATLVVHEKRGIEMANSKILSQINSTSFLMSQSDDLESYSTKVLKAKEWIEEGDVYQINLSQQFCFHHQKNPYDIFQELARINPAPFSAYLGFEHFAIVSSSPERFLKKEKNKIEARPIKGTIARGKNPKEDLLNQNELLNSIKNRAELVMITDLMRNDLGKISLPGTVKVEKLMTCEKYSNVFHLLSIISGEVNPQLHPLDVIRSTFPGGSITGCPKLRAMELIAKLEKRPRGIYTGSIGYLTGQKDFDFNIAIRTLFIHSGSIKVQLGGAIVADSNPKEEYEETLQKGASIFQVLEGLTK